MLNNNNHFQNNKSGKSKPKKAMLPEIAKAWESYFVNRDDESKMKLYHHYQFLVRNISRPFWAKKPFILDMDDLKQAGNMRLWQAIERYNDGSNATFETFASLHVRGGMLDEINSLDWTPRKMRRLIRVVIAAETKLRSHGEEITLENIAKETGFTDEEIITARSSTNRTFIIPADQEAMAEYEASNETTIMNDIYNGTNALIYGENDGLEFRISLMKELTVEERKVIYLRFFYCETVARTAEILKIKQSRVSSIQKQALGKLKAHYESDRL